MPPFRDWSFLIRYREFFDEAGKRAGRGAYSGMRKLPMVSAGLLAAGILFLFRNELHARGPPRLEPATQCGFWDDMYAGMSCR